MTTDPESGAASNVTILQFEAVGSDGHYRLDRGIVGAVMVLFLSFRRT
jgi:hypothetical protein